MTSNKDLILEDLQATELTLIFLELCPYSEFHNTLTQVVLTFEKILIAKDTGDRISIIIYTYYLDARLSSLTPIERTLYRGYLILYYKRVSMRIYYLFESMGVNLLNKTY
ncbi:30_t:CDS:1 [Scutellospora calospora]|uniref:30_t:CDS:1 n=1 Tax=Scutellospora calospora TaxID=85575 RepID=A0ACA9JUP8_9GLOM|nr:30_t:CDS:1 [Scutellospora calospora]